MSIVGQQSFNKSENSIFYSQEKQQKKGAGIVLILSLAMTSAIAFPFLFLINDSLVSVFILGCYCLLNGQFFYIWQKQKQALMEIGLMPLQLTSSELVIGGRLSGQIATEGQFQPSVVMTLKCMRRYSRTDRSGDVSKAKYQEIWSKKSHGFLKPSDDNAVLFEFDIPADLPASSVSKDQYDGIVWQLFAEGDYIANGKNKAEKLQRHWEIPLGHKLESLQSEQLAIDSEKDNPENKENVEDLAERTIPKQFSEQSKKILSSEAEKQALTEVLLLEEGEKVSLYSLSASTKGKGMIPLAAGATAGAAGFTLFAFSSGIMLILGLAALALGLAAMGLGIWFAGKQLQADIFRRKITVERTCFGFTIYKKMFLINDAGHISYAARHGYTDNGVWQYSYGIFVQDQNEKVLLAENLQGEESAMAMQAIIQDKVQQQWI